MKTFHINLLKQYVDRENVGMTATPGQRDSGGNPGGNLDQGPECPGGKLQAATVNGTGKIVVGASADYV